MSTIFCDENHAKDNVESICKRWQDQELCDVVLIAGKDSTKVAAHRLILSASSEYFSKMFTIAMRETHSENITLSDIEGEILQLIVEFFYTGRLEIREDIVEELLATAHYLLLEVIVLNIEITDDLATQKNSRVFHDEKHVNNTLERLYKKWQEQELCDVVLIAGKDGTKVIAHRLILSASSEYFRTLLTSSTCESHSENIVLSDIEGEILKLLVEFLYTGRLEISEDNVEKLLATAHYLSLKVIVSACSKFLADQLCLTNCLRFAAIAKRYECIELKKKASAYIFKNFMDIYKSDDFLNLNFEELCELLKNDVLCVSSEEIVFHSLMLWIQHEQAMRDKYKYDLLKLVRMPQLDVSFLMDNIQPICSSTEFKNLLSETINWHLMPKRRKIDVSTDHYQTKPRIPVDREKLLFFIEREGHINIKCYLPHCNQWIKCTKNIELKNVTSYAILDDVLYIIAHGSNSIGCFNFKTLDLSFTMKECRFSPSNHRTVHLVVLKRSLYVISLKRGPHSQCELQRWDPITQAWQNCSHTPYKYYQANFVECNEKLYIFNNGQRCPHFYNPDINRWRSIPEMKNSESRSSLGVSMQFGAASGFLYAFGGNSDKSMERYDPCTNKWHEIYGGLPEFPNSRILCATMNDKLIVLYNNHLEEYDGTKGTWSRLMDTNRNDKIIGLTSYSGEISPKHFVID